MRHLVHGRKLGRTSSHRLALRRNLVQSLFEHGAVRTTVTKAKEARPFAERLITLAIDGSLASRQRAEALLQDRAIIPKPNRKEYDRMSDAKRAKVLRARSGRRHRANMARPGLKFSAESVLHKLFADIGPKMRKRDEERNCAGGYTRIVKLAQRRLGDAGQLALLQIVGTDDKPRVKSTTRTERKRRARVKYTVYAGKPRSQRGRRRPEKAGPKAGREGSPAPQAAPGPEPEKSE